MRLLRLATLLAAASIFIAAPASAQSTARDATREKVRQVLETAGARSDVNVAFPPEHERSVQLHRLDDREHGERRLDGGAGQHHEVRYDRLPGVSALQEGLHQPRPRERRERFARKLLLFTEQNYMYWGADEMGDVFSGFTISLESGFPQEVMVIVLRSIKSSDECVGELRPFIDGSKGI